MWPYTCTLVYYHTSWFPPILFQYYQMDSFFQSIEDGGINNIMYSLLEDFLFHKLIMFLSNIYQILCGFIPFVGGLFLPTCKLVSYIEVGECIPCIGITCLLCWAQVSRKTYLPYFWCCTYPFSRAMLFWPSIGKYQWRPNNYWFFILNIWWGPQ